MNTEEMVNVSSVSLHDLIQAAYSLSSPQGLGVLHARSGPLTQEEVDDILAKGTPRLPVAMDYVNGRSCKFRVIQSDDGQRFISKYWYDHSENQFDKLLAACGLASR